MTTERCSGGAHGEGWPLWLEYIEGLDVRACGPHKLMVIVEVLLGEGRLPLPCALYLYYLQGRHSPPTQAAWTDDHDKLLEVKGLAGSAVTLSWRHKHVEIGKVLGGGCL